MQEEADGIDLASSELGTALARAFITHSRLTPEAVCHIYSCLSSNYFI